MTTPREVMPTVILAGGLATRLKPLTEKIPKALVEVAGQPFLAHQLSLLKRSGVNRVVLLVGYLGESIRERFGDGSDLQLSITYSFDGPELLGTAGAIRHALDVLPERFFVLYGDSYLTCDYAAIEDAFISSRMPGLMTVYRNDNRYDRSNVEFDGSLVRRYDKRNSTPEMHHIDYGLGAFERHVFEPLPVEQRIDLESVYQSLIHTQRLAAFEVKERFYEIGSPEGLRETADFLLGR